MNSKLSNHLGSTQGMGAAQQTVQINAQLQQMLAKLKSKVQNEVQLRIGNQRKLDIHMRQVGIKVSENLITQFDKQVNELNNDVDTFELSLKDWEQEMMSELGENKIQVSHFNTEVGTCLETMSKTMNSKYSITTEYHQKVIHSLDSLEQQVFKPANTSKNFLPPALPQGEKIISAIQGEIQTEEQARAAEQDAAKMVENQDELDQEIDVGSGTPVLYNQKFGRSRKESFGSSQGHTTPKAARTPSSAPNGNQKRQTSFTQQLNNIKGGDNKQHDQLSANSQHSTGNLAISEKLTNNAENDNKIGKSVLDLERQRNQMEMNLLQDIVIFNQRVTQQVAGLENSVRDEITGMQVEQQKEEERRIEADCFLTKQVQDFLGNLQNPQMISPEQMKAQHASQMKRLLGSPSQQDDEYGEGQATMRHDQF